jgi:hypothetical protein
MSVPLDRLYNFLYDIANRDDLVIYGFYPHGSRKLEDLKILSDIKEWSWLKLMTSPCLIFHDQEPLNYNLYSHDQFKDYVDTYGDYFPSENPKNLVISMHLRACVKMPAGVYDQVLLCHSEKNSSELELYIQNGFIGVYHWSHALIARDWYRFADVDPKLIPNFDSITHDFLIYNRAWSGTREYRLTFAEILVNHQLLSCCKTKFSEFDNQVHFTQHKFDNKELSICCDNLHELYPVNSSDSDSSADYDAEDYASIAIEVVLETVFNDSRHHLTEKSLRPIACGRPFILASTPGSLQYLKQYGFKTFDGLIDETYDTIINSRMRLEAIAREMERISCLDYNEKKALWTRLYAIASHNKKLFFSAEWQDSIIKEFKNNFELGMSQLTATGKYQKKLERMALTDPALAYRRSNDSLIGHGPTVQDRQALEHWVERKNSLI